MNAAESAADNVSASGVASIFSGREDKGSARRRPLFTPRWNTSRIWLRRFTLVVSTMLTFWASMPFLNLHPPSLIFILSGVPDTFTPNLNGIGDFNTPMW